MSLASVAVQRMYMRACTHAVHIYTHTHTLARTHTHSHTYTHLLSELLAIFCADLTVCCQIRLVAHEDFVDGLGRVLLLYEPTHTTKKEWVMTHLNESCHVWMSHVNITYERVISHMNESCLICLVAHEDFVDGFRRVRLLCACACACVCVVNIISNSAKIEYISANYAGCFWLASCTKNYFQMSRHVFGRTSDQNRIEPQTRIINLRTTLHVYIHTLSLSLSRSHHTHTCTHTHTHNTPSLDTRACCLWVYEHMNSLCV